MTHIELRNISKHFGGVQALNRINLSIARGTVHALVGENGAGKSTLGKIISGVLRPDEGGEVWVDGQLVRFHSPVDALAQGVTILSQEIALAPRLSVLDNVFLGIESKRWGLVRQGRLTRQRFTELRARSGFTLDPDQLVGQLSVAQMKQVEILKALARNARLIVMDEPTAALPKQETEQLLAIIGNLRQLGVTVVFVSHFLQEVLGVADTITVLRDGQLIKTGPAQAETPETLVTAMLGRAMSLTFPAKRYPAVDAPVVVSVQGLRKANVIDAIALELRAGEIVGLAGLVGSGRSAVARAIFGALPGAQGQIAVDGVPVRIASPTDAVRAGIALLPESRKKEGLLLGLPIRSNMTLPHLDLISQGGIVQQKQERSDVAALVRQLDVRPPDVERAVGTLSGGNQQKVLFGKWLFRQPRLLIADEPTHGVDVGAKRAIYELIVRLAAEGMSILLISSELEEILGLAHRVLVMRQGRIVAEFTESADGAQRLAEDEIMRAAFAAG